MGRTLLAAGTLATALLCSACGGSQKGGQVAKTTPTEASTPRTFADVVAQVRSGVIRVEVDTCDGSGVGTGILIGPRLVATVEHVIDGAQTITLKRAGKIVARGTVVGSDAARDVALVRTDHAITGYRFAFAKRAPRLGEDVAAIGFPLGLPLTVTRGSVSGMNRTIPIDGVERNRLVQTDAAVNPGNSGGPLMTDLGQVVGLVDLGTNQANGLAFAVSSSVAGPLIQSWTAAPQPVSAPACATPPQAQAAPAPPATTTGNSSIQTYTGQDFSIAYPAAWIVSAAEVNKGSYYDTTISPPGDRTLLLRVDENPTGGSSSLEAAAAPVIASLRKDPSYTELDLSHTSYQGGDALLWEFLVIERGVLLHKVDLFFIDPTTGSEWAILTQAPADQWTQDSSAFDTLRATFQATS
jgi:S1-C subfamily serine protease